MRASGLPGGTHASARVRSARDAASGVPLWSVLKVAFRHDDHVVGGERNVLVLAAALDDFVQVDDERLLSAVAMSPDDLGAVGRRLVSEASREGNTLDRRGRLLQLVRARLLHLAH